MANHFNASIQSISMSQSQSTSHGNSFTSKLIRSLSPTADHTGPLSFSSTADHTGTINSNDILITSNVARWQHPYCSMKYKFTRIQSKSAILVLVWNFLVFTCTSGVYGIILDNISKDISFLRNRYAWRVTIVSLVKTGMWMTYPIGGWIADSFTGRYKLIHHSMQLIWMGTVALSISLVCQHMYSDSHVTNSIVRYGVFPIVFVAVLVALAGFQSNVVPFGTDQMQGASGEELSSFVYWYIWTEMFGFGVIYTVILSCATEQHTLHITYSLIMVACMSIALSLDYIFKNILTIEPPCGNPLVHIATVLGHILNRKPRGERSRSALTYWEDRKLTLFDLAKQRYGGPYRSDYVETVQSALQIIKVLASTVVSSGAVGALGAITGQISNHFNSDVQSSSNHSPVVGPNTSLPMALCYEKAVVSNLYVIVIITVLPLLQFIVFPVLRNCIPSILKRFGLGLLLIIASALSFFFLDLIGRITYSHHDNNTLLCFLVDDPLSIKLSIAYQWLAVPNIFLGLAYLNASTANIEFICAQAPHNMKGFLIGTSYCLVGISMSLGYVILLAFYLGFSTDKDAHSGCGTWYFLINVLLAVTGFLLFCIVSFQYRPRVRDDDSFEQMHIERYYEETMNP